MPQRERPVAEFTAIIEVAFSDNFTKKNLSFYHLHLNNHALYKCIVITQFL